MKSICVRELADEVTYDKAEKSKDPMRWKLRTNSFAKAPRKQTDTSKPNRSKPYRRRGRGSVAKASKDYYISLKHI